MKRIMCIALVEWPLQRLIVARPELSGKAVILYETRRGSQRVAGVSSAARRLGITIGMPLGEAMAMSKPGGVCVEPYDAAADREALHKLAEAYQRFSPLVGLEESPSPDSLFLDIGRPAHLFDGETRLVDAICEEFSRRRLAIRWCVAGSAAAAWAIAHFGASGIVVAPGGDTAALRPLPVEALRLPGNTVALLRQLGLYRIGQLESLAREEFSARFGPELLRRWDQATGKLPEPIRSETWESRFEVDGDLEYPTVDRRRVETLLESLMARMAAMLAAAGRGALQIECRLDCDPLPVRLSVGLFRPSDSSSHLTGLLKTRLERVRVPGPVNRLWIEAVSTAPIQRRQESLLAEGLPVSRSRELALLIDRLASRLGRRGVLGVRLSADAQPEFAYRYEPLVEEGTARRRRAAHSSEHSLEYYPRPLRLLMRPAPLAALAVMPDGPPWRFTWQGEEQDIAACWGPERIQTGWWRGTSTGRDYYRVETSTGRRYWLFRRLRDGRWFLHGKFA